MYPSRVLMIAPYFPPVMTAGTFRTVRFVKYLPDYGWEPIVLTVDASEEDAASALQQFSRLPIVVRTSQSSPLAFLRRVREHRSTVHGEANSKASADEPGIAAHRDGAIRRHLKSLLRNPWCLLTETPDKNVPWVLPAVRCGGRAVREYQPSVLYTSGPPHSVHLAGLVLKRVTGLPWVADFRDPWARAPWGLKPRNPWGQRLWPWFERVCVRAADRVILNTERMADEFQRHYSTLDREKFLCIPNGCDPELADQVDRLLAERPAERANGCIRLCHAGSLYRKRDPRPLIEAIGLLRDRGINVRFEQIGHCSPQFNLEAFIADRGLQDCVRIEPPRPHHEALQAMAQADVLTIIQPGTDLQVPGKLFEMLLFRKPILAIADEGATADVIRNAQVGVVTLGNSPQAIQDALERLAANHDRTDDSERCRKAQATFDGKALTGRLAAVFAEFKRAERQSTQ